MAPSRMFSRSLVGPVSLKPWRRQDFTATPGMAPSRVFRSLARLGPVSVKSWRRQAGNGSLPCVSLVRSLGPCL